MPKCKTDLERKIIHITYDDGEVESFPISGLSLEIQTIALMDRMKAKLVDTYAGAKKAESEGHNRNDWSKAQIAQVWDNLLNDKWTDRGEGSTRETYLLIACVEFFETDKESVLESWKAKESDLTEVEYKEYKKKLASHPRINAIVARLKLEALQAKAAKLELAADGETIDDIEL